MLLWCVCVCVCVCYWCVSIVYDSVGTNQPLARAWSPMDEVSPFVANNSPHQWIHTNTHTHTLGHMCVNTQSCTHTHCLSVNLLILCRLARFIAVIVVVLCRHAVLFWGKVSGFYSSLCVCSHLSLSLYVCVCFGVVLVIFFTSE